MKYLKRFNESIENDITQECEDILLELTDDEIEIKMYSSIGTLNIFLGDQLGGTISSPALYDFSKFKNSFEHLFSYMKEQGFILSEVSVWESWEKSPIIYNKRKRYNDINAFANDMESLNDICNIKMEFIKY